MDAVSRRAVVDVVKTRSRTLGELVHQAVPFLGDAVEYDAAAVAGGWTDPAEAHRMLAAIRARLGEVPSWETANLQAALRGLAGELGISDGTMFPPLRVALTGLSMSPGIFEVLVALGRERSLVRIAAAERHLEGLVGAA
jgi:glutamyl-tRNA synthetase